jgi:hypothetical protein
VGVGRVAEADKVEVDGAEVGSLRVDIFREATGRGGSKMEKWGIHCKVEVEVCSILIGDRWQVDLQQFANLLALAQ